MLISQIFKKKQKHTQDGALWGNNRWLKVVFYKQSTLKLIIVTV